MRDNQREFIYATLAGHLGLTARELGPNKNLYLDFGLTPLGLVGVILDLERAFGVELSGRGLERIRTPEQLVRELRQAAERRSRAHAKPREGMASASARY